MVSALCACVRNCFSFQGCENILLCVLPEALWLGVHIMGLTQVGFCMWSKIGIEVDFFL